MSKSNKDKLQKLLIVITATCTFQSKMLYVQAVTHNKLKDFDQTDRTNKHTNVIYRVARSNRSSVCFQIEAVAAPGRLTLRKSPKRERHFWCMRKSSFWGLGRLRP